MSMLTYYVLHVKACPGQLIPGQQGLDSPTKSSATRCSSGMPLVSPCTLDNTAFVPWLLCLRRHPKISLWSYTLQLPGLHLV